MATKLTYQSPKWVKARAEVLKIGYNFANSSNVNGYIRRLRESGAEKRDYAHYFASLSLCYHSWATDRYLINPSDPMLIDEIYRSGISGVISQQLGGLPLPQWKVSFETALYELTALDCTEIEYFQDRKSVLSCMLMNDFELAEQMLLDIEMDVDARIGSQYIELKYLKNLYLHIIYKDEALFNEEAERRIKTYRRNPYTHAVIIDFPLTALIKIANKNGIDYWGDVAEVPRTILSHQFSFSREQLKPPLSNEASDLFGIYCG